jgi:hypothetical protein
LQQIGIVGATNVAQLYLVVLDIKQIDNVMALFAVRVQIKNITEKLTRGA